MTGNSSFNLDTPVGRRAVEAMNPNGWLPENRHRLQAALGVLRSDVCQTCGGSGFAAFNPSHAACLACNNGKVKPAIPTWDLLDEAVNDEASRWSRRLERHRTEVVTELIGALEDTFKYSSNSIEAFAADFIRNREFPSEPRRVLIKFGSLTDTEGTLLDQHSEHYRYVLADGHDRPFLLKKDEYEIIHSH